jgi:hypothetical protein
MDRRTLLTSLVGGAIASAAGTKEAAAAQATAQAGAPEFYLWRQYTLRNGTQPRRLAEFLKGAALPALNRIGHQPIGVFEVVAGIAGPGVVLLIPMPSLAALESLDSALERDDQYLKSGAAYVEATAADPPFIRQEVSLLAATRKVPRLVVPAATAKNAPRLFELRTYESPTERGHAAKVRMFTEMGEIDIFRRVGLTPVFFSRTLAGPRMPSLVYMLVHDNMAAREKSWDAFRNDPDWKKLASTPGYADAEIVSNITTVFLRPAAYSQI